MPWHFSRNTARQTDKPLGMFPEKLKVNSRLAVKAFGIAQRHHFYKIFVALFIFAQQYKMIRVGIQPEILVEPGSAGNIHLAADDRLYPLSFALVVKIHSRKHISVIGHGKGSLPHFLCTAHHILYAAGAVKQTVFAVNMKIYKHMTAPFP